MLIAVFALRLEPVGADDGEDAYCQGEAHAQVDAVEHGLLRAAAAGEALADVGGAHKEGCAMAPAMGLMVVMMAAPCGLRCLGRALRPWVSPVMQADTDTAIRANMAERAVVWVSIFR